MDIKDGRGTLNIDVMGLRFYVIVLGAISMLWVQYPWIMMSKS